MSLERRMALSPRQPFNRQRVRRISGFQTNTKLRLTTANVGTMTGRSREIVEMFRNRKVDIGCIQEVRYKGQGTRVYGDEEKYKFWWSGSEGRANGVGIMVRESLIEEVIDVKRFDDRMMKIAMVCGRKILHVFSVYAPQQGRPEEEKREFLEKLSDRINEVPEGDLLMVAGDMNSHIGMRQDGFEDVMGCFGFGERNQEGEEMLRLCQEHNLRVMNTYFKKKREQLITYKSGGNESQVDYVMFQKHEEMRMKDCKVIPGEECLTQHRLLCADILIRGMKRRVWKRREKRMKTWKLRDDTQRRIFEEKVSERVERERAEGENVERDRFTNAVLDSAKEICGETKGGRQRYRETWWWNEEVQGAIKEKKMAYKRWQKRRTEEAHEQYRVKRRQAKRAVAIAKDRAWKEWSEYLKTRGGRAKIFRIAKQMKKERKDIVGAKYIKDENGTLKVKEEEVMERWRRYFSSLLNETNAYQLEEEQKIEGPIWGITESMIEKALKNMKADKAPGPSGITSDLLKAAGATGVKGLFQVCETIEEQDEVPVNWGGSFTIPVYKGKGDVLMVDKHRGVRLLEHDMKVYEKTLEWRLREIVNINENQFGFQQGKSTVDAIFIVRQLQEKFRAKKKELFHIFVDLEKAFDRVPREAIVWALRRQKVPERLITLIMALYRNSRSKVRTLAGTSEEFEIGVGVHQGSALSPLLFVVVMQEATRAAREEDMWDLLYADDLVITAESEEEAVRKLHIWKREMETRGLKVNIDKTKMMVVGREPMVRPQRGRYPCGVCGEGVGVNSVWCQGCERWCHQRCSGLRNLRRAGENFRCPTCIRGRAEAQRNLEVGEESVEIVDSFRYLGDTMTSEGGVESAVRDRISSAWNKWRELASLLVNQSIPLKERTKVYCACVRSVLLYAAETWPLTERLEGLLSSCDQRMLRYMAKIRWQDRVTNEEVRERCGVEDIGVRIRGARLRWFGHVKRREENNILRRVYDLEVEGRRPVGRPKKGILTEGKNLFLGEWPCRPDEMSFM